MVKELLENALDAGAKRISVELEEGGRRLIRVVDDGCGMSRDDLVLCVERFATSKLSDAEELAAIATLGFRGEALPSVGSVSRLAITSRLPEQDSAWRLTVEGGEKGAPEPAGGAPGTAVEVRDLFYNVPARRKFLKTARTELNRSLAAITGLALARPDVAFAVEHEGRVLLDLPAVERLADRVAGIYAPGLVEKLAEAEAELGSGARVRGLVGLPTEHRSNASDVHVFVGGRPVRDRAVTAAVGAAYTGLLPARRYPVVFLFAEFPPGDVDFNVHPAKAEVRFARTGEVFTLFERAVRGALSRAELATAGGPAPYEPPTETSAELPERVADAPPRSARPRFTKGPASLPRESKVKQGSLNLLTGSESRAAGPGPGPGRRPESAERETPGEGLPASGAPEAGKNWRYIGQVLDGFLLVERGGGLLVVDQHALHERLIYEELRAGRESGSVASQGLVIPQNVETGRRHAEVLRESREDLAALGFDIEEFGGNGFLVRSVPAAVGLSDLAGYLTELAEELAEGDVAGGSSGAEARRERVLATVACKAAVKAGERMSPPAAEDLLRRGLSPGAGGPLHTCPHGRPTCFLMERAEIARRVGRK